MATSFEVAIFVISDQKIFRILKFFVLRGGNHDPATS